MDAGLANRPVVSVVSDHAQPGIALAPAPQTELPGAKSVIPVVHAEPPQNEPRKPDQKAKSTTHDAIIDPQTNEVVYRTLDARTRQVVHQVPDQALLRMQAYARAKAIRALADSGNASNTAQSTDLHVDTLT